MQHEPTHTINRKTSSRAITERLYGDTNAQHRIKRFSGKLDTFTTFLEYAQLLATVNGRHRARRMWISSRNSPADFLWADILASDNTLTTQAAIDNDTPLTGNKNPQQRIVPNYEGQTFDLDLLRTNTVTFYKMWGYNLTGSYQPLVYTLEVELL